MKTAFKHLQSAAAAKVKTYNHTDYVPTARTPIAVSVETKVAGEGHESGLAQLSTWALAHFRQLSQLLSHARNTTTQMPVLPLVLVQGASWQFSAAMQDPFGRVVCNVSNPI